MVTPPVYQQPNLLECLRNLRLKCCAESLHVEQMDGKPLFILYGLEGYEKRGGRGKQTLTRRTKRNGCSGLHNTFKLQMKRVGIYTGHCR